MRRLLHEEVNGCSGCRITIGRWLIEREDDRPTIGRRQPAIVIFQMTWMDTLCGEGYVLAMRYGTSPRATAQHDRRHRTP